MKSPQPFILKCGMCGLEHDAAQVQHLCTVCARPLLAHYDLDSTFGSEIRSELSSGPHSLWRYRRVLPVSDAGAILSLGEGCTPLLPALSLGRVLGLRALSIKDESQNPTGSFKARGMTAAISRARELGVNHFCLPSAGNAAGAAAAYAAMAGVSLRAFMPADSGDGFFAECRAYGADVVAVEGTIADCGARMKSDCPAPDWFDLSTLKEPFRLEGKKTMGYELFEDCDGELPDAIVYPTGGGTGLIGMWKAFDEMQAMGWIGDKRPRLISVQTEGCAPIVQAFAAGEETATPIANPQTAALGLRVPGAVGDFLILRAIRETGGTAVAVTEDEWAEGQALLARHTGLFPSPEGGAALAGLQKLLFGEIISPADHVVVFNTGTGFKYPPATWPQSSD